MYCVLKYIDYLHYKRYLNESVSTLKSIRSTEADPYNTKLYFNPNCILQLILDYICTEAHINIDGDHYDLCNINGELLHIQDYKPTINGLTIFHPRERYFIVVIRRNETKTEIEEIAPMLNPNSDICAILVNNIKGQNITRRRSTTLRPKSSTASKRSHGSKTSNSSKSKRPPSANI
ncbi:hypothetical protein Zmor_002306 [Zophobas morio]|uniref:Uncharacterized protein n=1 Tax=Zophobas morio TaxID=2755281 RepID=A0AA38MTG0_9CUCU|nr:hypothetical protein Zmor_002306 [Zophobas morio]